MDNSKIFKMQSFKIIGLLLLFYLTVNIAVGQSIPFGFIELGKGANRLFANGDIQSIVKDKYGNIYAAGDFTNSTGKYYVAIWNGINWSELGTGSNALNANSGINAIVVDTFGNVYAAGGFRNSFNKKYVAKWNGTSWSELGTGSNALNANGNIFTIALDTLGNVYAAGAFTNSAAKCYVAKWSGTAWSELGSGSNALNANQYIHALCFDKAGNLYAGGVFSDTTNPMLGHKYVAKWNGTTWSKLGTGNNALHANNSILALTTNKQGNIYAAGVFTDSSISTNGHRFVAKWDGTTWNELGVGINSLNANGNILSVSVDNKGNVYSAGSFADSVIAQNGHCYVAKWDGTNWKEMGGGKYRFNGIFGYNLGILSSIITILRDEKDKLYFGGAFVDSSNHQFVAMWNDVTISHQSICSGRSYVIGHDTLRTAGVYYDTLSDLVGDDSIVELHLTINSPSLSNAHITICANHAYTLPNGQLSTSSGTYLDTLTNYLGCDSIITTFLTVNPISKDTIIQTLCSNETFYFNGHQLSASGYYYDTIQNYWGCDSIVTLKLIVHNIQYKNINSSICANQNYTLPNGVNVQSAGIYIDTISTYQGCDSVIVTHLLVRNISYSSINRTICNGQFIVFNNRLLLSSGVYEDTFQNYLGCDSILTLNLYVIPKSIDTINESICKGDSILFNGHIIFNNGIYKDTLINYLGCDSLLILNLTVNLPPNITTSNSGATITALQVGASYQWINCDSNNIIPSALAQNYTASITGHYAVIISMGSCTDTSDCVYIEVSGLNEPFANNNQLKVFPNPTINGTTITLTKIVDEATIKLISLTGQTIIEKQKQTSDHFYLDMSQQAKGIYIIEIIQHGNVWRSKIVKQ